MRNRHHSAAHLALLLVLALGLSGCGFFLAPPAETVQDLLRLRRSKSTDAEAYSALMNRSDLATALANDSRTWDTKDTAPIPDWKRPEVVKEGTSTAEVRITWKKSKDHPGWATSTVFTLAKFKGDWIILDTMDESSNATNGTASETGSSTAE